MSTVIKCFPVSNQHPPFCKNLPLPSSPRLTLKLLCGCQVVVKSDDVGLQLVRLLNKRGQGRVTFMPLNRLQSANIDYPRQFGSDAVPMYKMLKTEEQYVQAVQQVSSRLFTAAQATGSCYVCML